MTTKYYSYISLLIIIISLISCDKNEKAASDAYLSNLQADESSPLFTTYAAAMDRSEFVLDEGYQFIFYESDKPISFFTDAGPDVSFIFEKDGERVHTLSDMHKKPVIKTSYPDLVVYEYQPFEDITVEISMLVHSSRGTFWDIRLTNNTESKADITIIPYIRNVDGAFGEGKEMDTKNSFHFTHDQHPDSWTRNQELPHITKRWNVFKLSEPADEMGMFNSFCGEDFIPPAEALAHKDPVFQVSGRAYTKGKSRIMQKSPQSRIQVYLGDDKRKVITQNSPVYGKRQSIIDNQGYFQFDMGILGDISSGNSFTFTYYDETTESVKRYTETINDSDENIRKDVTLQDYNLPAIPQQVQLKKIEDKIKLTWQVDSEGTFRVYRRNYEDPYYELLQEGLTDKVFVDSTIAEGAVYGYIIVTEDNQKREIGMHSREVTNIPKYNFKDFLNGYDNGGTNLNQAKVMAFKKYVSLDAGNSNELRLSRYVDDQYEFDTTIDKVHTLEDQNIKVYIRDNEQLFENVPEADFSDDNREKLYWSSFNMMRQVFYPSEGKSSYNYYVFSREPVWGWGHGGQVFHESITMMAYALLDSESAMNSQRVYKERQYENGYINYRTGSYLDEIIEYNDQLTSSAPWYSWINYEVYKMTGDKEFLKEMYESSKAFYEFYVKNRDSDNDGLAEWGGHAVLESVRDASVAVWDEVGWPSNFEGVDVNSMLVKEAKSLEKMALELGLKEDAKKWRQDHQKRAELINETFWDEENGFYYNVDKKTHSFSHKTKNDLKRDEIIGFLPLWAGIATEEQAKKLVEKLTDPDQFWRKYGVPSLSASDPYYNDKGYWNGPVWVEWNYLVMQGLLKYGYEKEAKELVDRVAESMIIQLKDNHTLWEFYSPDDEWGGYHHTYIWAGIINRMLLDTRDI